MMKIKLLGFILFFSLNTIGQDLKLFGYKSTPALGERPLLIILVDYSNAKFNKEHSLEYYEEVFFGKGLPNIAGVGGFFHQNSNNRFLFKNAGIVGPYTYTDDPSTSRDESIISCEAYGNEICDNIRLASALKLAHQNGFDFSLYDSNNDGVVTNSELVVYVIGARKGREDNYATTKPEWKGGKGDVVHNYNFVRLEGYVYSVENSKPPNTIELNHWWSASREDNYTTSDPEWVGQKGDLRNFDYQFIRKEGYVFAPNMIPPSGTIPLYSWWSASRKDNFITSDSNWAGKKGDVKRAPDYAFVRKEGYLFSPELPQPPNTKPLYSWWNNEIAVGGGGVNRSTLPNKLKLGNIDVSITVAASGEYSNASVFAHELGHAIGQDWEAYGNASNNFRYTIMGSIDSTKDGFNLWHFDPFAKMAFGWVEPEVIASSEPKVINIWATELSPPSKNKAIIIYDPDRGYNEFFILEHRIKSSMPKNGDFIPIYNWWSSGRKDNFATSSPQWNGNHINKKDPNYVNFRMEGLAFNPLNPPPSRTVPLYSWWNPIRKDNFMTSNPNWAGVLGDEKDGYKMFRLEGYAYSPDFPQPKGTIPLYSWWSSTREDNFITSSPLWDPNYVGEERDYDYEYFRLEGYLKNLPVFNYDGDPKNVGLKSLPDEGLAIWHVILDTNKRPRIVPSQNFLVPDNKVPLSAWYSSDRNDNYVTTKNDWDWKTNEAKYPDYRFVGTYAYIDIRNSSDESLIPLYSWWSPTREDNFITSDPNWAGQKGDVKSPDYKFVRKEGYIYSPNKPQPAKSMALYSWWNSVTGDNFITGEKGWTGEVGKQNGEYTLFRKEGYVKNSVDKLDSALYLIPPNGGKGQPSGSNGLWGISDGQGVINWHDGTTAFKIKVNSNSSSNPIINVKIN